MNRAMRRLAARAAKSDGIIKVPGNDLAAALYDPELRMFGSVFALPGERSYTIWADRTVSRQQMQSQCERLESQGGKLAATILIYEHDLKAFVVSHHGNVPWFTRYLGELTHQIAAVGPEAFFAALAAHGGALGRELTAKGTEIGNGFDPG